MVVVGAVAPFPVVAAVGEQVLGRVHMCIVVFAAQGQS